MTRRVERLGPLPNLPKDVQAAAGANDGDNARDRYIVDLRRCLEEWRQKIIKSGDIINASSSGGHVIQDEGISLTQRGHLNFIGAAVTAADDLANDATTVTITTGTQNLFETIAVAGQSNIVADSPTDTLTVAAGANITLTTNAGTDTLTIAAATAAPTSSGEHLMMLGELQSAQDDATIALGLASPGPRNTGTTFGDMWLWGSGRDGDIVFDGTNTFAFCEKNGNVYFTKRDIHANNMTINAGITVLTYIPDTYSSPNPNLSGGGRVFGRGTLTVNGLLSAAGINHAGFANPNVAVHGVYTDADSSYGTSGTSGAGGNSISNGSPGGNCFSSWGGNGGAGGTSASGRTGGAGGTATAPTERATGGVNWLWTPGAMVSGTFVQQGSPQASRFTAGAGGGGGGGMTALPAAPAGGSGGGIMGIFFRKIEGAGIISCDGGDGPPSSAVGNGVGPGGGGGGGILMVMTTSANYASTITRHATGGAGGAGNSGATNGTNGADGFVAELFIATLN